MSKKPVCPHCGSKDVSEVESFYHCHECHSDFGRPAVTDDGRLMEEAMTGLRFRYGDLLTGSVHLRMVQDEDGGCLFEVYDANEGGVDKVADVMTAEKWTEVRKQLFDDLYVMDWDREYYPVNDGREIQPNNAWELVVSVSDDEEYSYKGVDAYPVYWKKFMKLIEPYFDALKK
jgi:hypothetical protein